MRLLGRLYVLGFLGFLSFTSVDAQKFGYLDVQEILQSMPEVKEANANIETFRKQLESKGRDMLQALQAKYNDLNKRRSLGEVSPKNFEVEAQKIQAEEAEIATFQETSQRQFEQKSEELLNPLRNRIQAAIDQVSLENNYTYIFDLSTGFILYADDSTDVTAMVKKKLGM